MTYYEALRVLVSLEYELTAKATVHIHPDVKGKQIREAIKVVLGEDLKRLGMLDKPVSHAPGLLCPVHDGLSGNRAPEMKCNGRSHNCPKGTYLMPYGGD